MRKLLVIVILIIFGAVIAYTLNEDPHVFSDRECYNCHIDPDNHPTSLTRPVTYLCRGCHPEIMSGATHPVDVFPYTATVPPDLPLTNGQVTCNTCHDVHTSPKIVFGIESHFLRRQVSDVKDFCVACHEDNLSRPGHKELFIVAHEANKYIVTDPDGEVDNLSIQCIGCHDGSIGPVADYSLGSGIWMHSDDMSKGHPIGVDYMEARMQGSELNPVSSLDKGIRLFEGKVGCASCHDWFSSADNKLVMEMDRSRLCFECHYK